MSIRTLAPHRVVLLVLVVALLVVGGITAVSVGAGHAGTVHASAYFERVTGLYEGDEVRVLGVRVGTVSRITPQGTQVKVDFQVDPGHKIPATAKAAIVAPNLVTGRYIQLAPAYQSGPTLPDGAQIPQARTATPVEWDQIKTELNKAVDALGPQGANRDGAVNNLVDTAADNLDGNGRTLKQTIGDMAAAAETLSSGRQNLFGTIRNLNQFVEALNTSGEQLVGFSGELTSISSFLNDNRAQLGEALSNADGALQDIATFVRDNKQRLGKSVGALSELSTTLAQNQDTLGNLLHQVPNTLANFYNIYDPTTATLTGRPGINHTSSIPSLVCQSVFSVGGSIDDCRNALSPLLNMLNMETLPFGLNPLQRPGSPDQRPPQPGGQTPTNPQSEPQQEPLPVLPPETASGNPGDLPGLLLNGAG